MKVTKDFVADVPCVFKVKNIRFLNSDETDMTKTINRLSNESELIDENQPVVALARALLFYYSNVEFDLEELSYAANKKEYLEAIEYHETKAKYQPFSADDADVYVGSKDSKSYFKFTRPDDFYSITYSDTCYVVLQNDYLLLIDMIIDSESYKKVVYQLIYEYLRNVMSIEVS